MRVTMMFIPLALLLTAAACDETLSSLPEPTAVLITAPATTLMVGDAVAMAARVMDQNGQVMQALAPVFSTDNPAVATVNTEGMVRALAPGTANISASYGSTGASVEVTVTPDLRGELQSFEVLADSLVADVRAGVQSVAVRAQNGFGQPVCPQLSLRSSDASVATVRIAGGCRIEVVPAFVGETTIAVEAEGGRTDTFRVRVTNTGTIAFFSARPTAAQLVAGATVAYTVKVVNESGAGVANQRVNLDVTAGALSAASITTGSDGTATVQWSIPTHLRELGQTHSIALGAQLPNGRVTTRTETVFINGASLADIALYYAPGSRDESFTPIHTSVIRVPSFGVTLGAHGVDQYGNLRATDITFSFPGARPRQWGCNGSTGVRASSGIVYTCFEGYRHTQYIIRATAAEGMHRSVEVELTNGL